MIYSTRIKVLDVKGIDEGALATCSDATGGQGDVSFGTHFHLTLVEGTPIAVGDVLTVTLERSATA